MPTARVSIAVQSYAGLPEVGVELTEAAADLANGNRFTNLGGDVVFIARSTSGGGQTLQFTYTRRGQTVAQTAVNIAAAKTMVFGPFASEFGEHPSGDAASGDVYVTSSSAAILVSCVKLPGLSRVG